MLEDNTSSSDDMFLTNGGVRNHVSMYAQLANSRRKPEDCQRSVSTDEEEVRCLTISGPTSSNTLPSKKNICPVLTVSSGSDSDENIPSLLEGMRARHRRGRKRSRGNEGEKRCDGHQRGKTSSGNVDVFAFSDEDEIVPCSSVKRRRKRNILADIDADDESEKLHMSPDAVDVRTKHVLQMAVEAARRTDIAVLEAEAEQAAREAAAESEANTKEADAVRGNTNIGAISKEANGTPIVLKVRCGEHVHKLRIRTTDRLYKMLGPFCKKFGLDASRAVMEVDGEVITPSDTPNTYDLDDLTVVDVFIRSN